jgi:hypothetical protein
MLTHCLGMHIMLVLHRTGELNLVMGQYISSPTINQCTVIGGAPPPSRRRMNLQESDAIASGGMSSSSATEWSSQPAPQPQRYMQPLLHTTHMSINDGHPTSTPPPPPTPPTTGVDNDTGVVYRPFLPFNSVSAVHAVRDKLKELKRSFKDDDIRSHTDPETIYLKHFARFVVCTCIHYIVS